ncbi:MAG: hypothetical protein ABIK37_05040 [candidate division WOR-3 bacterium]
MTEKQIWKVRIRKAYAEETTHVVVGEVVEQNSVWVKLRCRAVHFRRPTMDAHVRLSEVKMRIFPWNTIAYVTVLPAGLEWERAKVTLTEHGDVVMNQRGEAAVELTEKLDG